MNNYQVGKGKMGMKSLETGLRSLLRPSTSVRGSLSKFEYTIIFTSATDREGNRDSLPQAPSVRRPPNSAELVQIRPSESGSSFKPL